MANLLYLIWSGIYLVQYPSPPCGIIATSQPMNISPIKHCLNALPNPGSSFGLALGLTEELRLTKTLLKNLRQKYFITYCFSIVKNRLYRMHQDMQSADSSSATFIYN